MDSTALGFILLTKSHRQEFRIPKKKKKKKKVEEPNFLVSSLVPKPSHFIL